MSDEEYSDDYSDGEEIDFEDVVEEGRPNAGKEIKPKVSPPIMWEYEKANILTERKKQLDAGSPTVLDSIGDLFLSYDIALREFEEGKLKYQLLRYVGKNFEIWRHKDFVYFPN